MKKKRTLYLLILFLLSIGLAIILGWRHYTFKQELGRFALEVKHVTQRKQEKYLENLTCIGILQSKQYNRALLKNKRGEIFRVAINEQLDHGHYYVKQITSNKIYLKNNSAPYKITVMQVKR
jgi:hypothetical protein